MNEETSTSRLNVAADSASEGELSLLRKEVIEARNLVIKTDNLLKNLHAELKQMSRRHDEQERRHWMTSVAAYVAFAVIASGGAIAYARAAVQSAHEEATANEARLHQLQQETEKTRTEAQARAEASREALRVYELLGSEKEGPGLNAAMSQALHLDTGKVSALEAKAINDRAAGLKNQIAENSLSRGNRAFRQSDFRTAGEELQRYVELRPNVDDPVVWYHLGSARMQTKDYAKAIPALEAYLKASPGTKTSQYAGMLLGNAYEETNNAQRAREVYEKAASLYPGSDFAPMIRNRLRRLSPAAGPATAAAPTAVR